MPNSVVEQIKERVDIVSLLESYIKLEKSGANFKARCPFHAEKTPSFFVSPVRGNYYCFGCSAKGDIFSFVEQFEGLDFKGALKVLAERAGVELKPERPEVRTERDRMYSILEDVTVFFEENLIKSEEVNKYLTLRGLSQKTIKTWRIGWVEAEWHTIRDYLLKKGYTDTEMETAGLTKKTEKGYYDRFRGRVIFPICDSSGRVIAFTGRILHDDGKSAKYLNSPETPFFNKSKTLFGFDKAKNAIRTHDYSILVEGQMDLIMSHQAGVVNAVASSGTAFTIVHLNLLKRLSQRIVLAFDSDKAGISASGRSAALALSLGMDVKIAAIVGGKDPADLILQEPKLWTETLKHSKNIIDFYLDIALAKKLSGRELIKELKTTVFPFLFLVESAMEKSHYVSLVAERAGIQEAAVWEDLKKTQSPLVEQPITATLGTSKETPEQKIRKDGIVRRLSGIIFWQTAAKDKNIDPEIISSRIVEISGEEECKKILKSMEAIKEELIFEAESYHGNTGALKKDVEELLREYEAEHLKGEFIRIMSVVSRAETAKNAEGQKEAVAEAQKIMERLKKIRKNSEP
ncbi:MAG: DNA primase [Candidatus Paceibacterota bacterium]|jgi:DNA primase